MKNISCIRIRLRSIFINKSTLGTGLLRTGLERRHFGCGEIYRLFLQNDEKYFSYLMKSSFTNFLSRKTIYIQIIIINNLYNLEL